MGLAQMQQNHIYDQLDNRHNYSPKRNRMLHLPKWLFQFHFGSLEDTFQGGMGTDSRPEDICNRADIWNTETTQVRKHQMDILPSIFIRTHQPFCQSFLYSPVSPTFLVRQMSTRNQADIRQGSSNFEIPNRLFPNQLRYLSWFYFGWEHMHAPRHMHMTDIVSALDDNN